MKLREYQAAAVHRGANPRRLCAEDVEPRQDRGCSGVPETQPHLVRHEDVTPAGVIDVSPMSGVIQCRRPRGKIRVVRKRKRRQRPGHARTDCPLWRDIASSRAAGLLAGGSCDRLRRVGRVSVKADMSAVVAHRGARVAWLAASWTSRNATPASSAAVMNACRSVWGSTRLVSPARRAILRTMRLAAWRSSRVPSMPQKMGPSQRSPTARSIARRCGAPTGSSRACRLCARSAACDGPARGRAVRCRRRSLGTRRPPQRSAGRSRLGTGSVAATRLERGITLGPVASDQLIHPRPRHSIGGNDFRDGPALEHDRRNDQTGFRHPSSVSDCPLCLATPVRDVLQENTSPGTPDLVKCVDTSIRAT